MATARCLALLAVAAALVFAPSAAADPDIASVSAAAVVEELQEQGYTVEINGVPSGDTALLTNCIATAIHKPDDATPDPAATVRVDVACPIQRG